MDRVLNLVRAEPGVLAGRSSVHPRRLRGEPVSAIQTVAVAPVPSARARCVIVTFNEGECVCPRVASVLHDSSGDQEARQ